LYVFVSASYVKLAKAITVFNSILLHSNKVVTQWMKKHMILGPGLI
jgi:hypothetical protein